MIISKDYKIESDSMNITLYKRSVSKKTSEEYWVAEGYFCEVKNALKYLVDEEIAGTGFKDVETISRKQNELYKMIDALTKNPTINKKPKKEAKR